MRPATKREALEKLAKIRNKIGYPDVWRIIRSSSSSAGFFRQCDTIDHLRIPRQAAKVGQPSTVASGRCRPDVNAYYDGS